MSFSELPRGRFHVIFYAMGFIGFMGLFQSYICSELFTLSRRLVETHQTHETHLVIFHALSRRTLHVATPTREPYCSMRKPSATIPRFALR